MPCGARRVRAVACVETLFARTPRARSAFVFAAGRGHEPGDRTPRARSVFEVGRDATHGRKRRTPRAQSASFFILTRENPYNHRTPRTRSRPAERHGIFMNFSRHAARAKRVLHREIAAQGTRPYAVRREVRPRPYSPVSPITLPRARSTTALYQEIAGTEGQHCSAHAGASGKRPKHGGACRRCTPRPQSVSCITEIAAQDATAGRAGRGVLPSPRTVRKVLWDDSLHFLFGAPSPAGFAITAATRTRRAGRVGMRLP